jgi:hypothetical protein
MTPDLTQYLESIRYNAHLQGNDETGVMSELTAHIEDKLQELKDSGMSDEEAVTTCLGEMGDTKSIARKIYEAYSQGTWKHVFLATLPHIVLGFLFLLNWWQSPGWLAMSLILIITTTIYGWKHGQPTWVFSWLGYSMLPVIVGGILLLYIPRGWSFLVLTIYLPLAVWSFFRIFVTTTKKDWLFSSLMLLPVAIFIGWFLALSPSGKLTEESMNKIYYYAPWIGLSFMALAATIAIFIRLRQRWLRITLLGVSGVITIGLIVYYSAGQFNNMTLLGPLMAIWAVLILPPLLERRLKNNKRRAAWLQNIHNTGLPPNQ